METQKDAQPKRPFHELVAEKLIAQLEAGTAPWQKPWEAGEPGSFMPMNPTTGKRYKGVNAIHLMSQGRDDERWMTYKQATATGAQVRRGEKGTPVQYWKFDEEQDKRDESGKVVRGADGQPVKEHVKLERPRVFYATVFNAEQVDGLPPRQPKPPQTWDASERAEAILKASGAKIQHGEHDRAFYRPSTDQIHLPDREQFPSADRYYATALHELGHWTGHPTRLDRDLVHPFGSEGYAKEELRAEIASMVLGDELGLGHDPGQHAAYVASWVKVLKDDPLEIFRAASDAEKIRDHVIGLEQKQTQSQQAANATAPTPAIAAVLATSIDAALNDPSVSFDHFADFAGADQGATLREALATQQLATVGDITGHEPANFYAEAFARLGEVFGQAEGTTNAALERKGLAQHFASTAETLVQSAERRQVPEPSPEVSMNRAKDVQPTYRDELARLLKASTLTPGVYEPSETVKTAQHAAVLVAGKPVVLTGPSDDGASMQQAEALAANAHLRTAVRAAGHIGEISAGVVAGDAVNWQGTEAAIVHKDSGQVESGDDDGPLLAIVLEDQHQALATALSINTSVARVFDANAPELDDGHALSRLARAEELAATPTAAEISATHGLNALPSEWTGQVVVDHVVEFENGRIWSANDVAQAGGAERLEPGVAHSEKFQLHARDGAAAIGEPAFVFIGDRASADEAHEIAEQLTVAHALTIADEYEKAARMAKVVEDRIRRDPNSSDEDRSAAKEARKAAEASAFAAVADTEQREAELRLRDQGRADRERGAGGENRPVEAITQAPGNERAGQPPARTVLDVPYREKNQAKDLGAKWDRGGQTWYVPPGVDPAPFARWKPNTEPTAERAPDAASLPNPQPAADRGLQAGSTPSAGASEPRATPAVAPTAREYLAVPYVDRVAAKAAGALWDKAASSWYVGPKGDAAELAKWKPENTKVEQAPAMSPQEEFADALRAMGLVTTDPKAKDQHPIMDGKRHRIAAEGDKPGEKAGFYVGHLDGHPAGYIKNNRTGKDLRWKSKGYVLDPAEKAKLQAEAATKLAAREAEQTATHEKTADRLARQMAAFVPVAANDTTPYLAAKGVKTHAGVFTDAAGKDTIIPAIDTSGKQWSTQYVKEDGTKRFAKDSRKEGCFHPVGGMAALDAAPVIIVAEGYATAATIAEAVGHATVAGFDSGNLPAVARALRERYPDRLMLIAGDDDQAVKLKDGVNPGAEKAAEAAKAVGGKAITPIFATGEQQAEPKRFSDFNDLATKSALGAEAVARQVGAAIKSLQVDRDDDRKQVLERQQEQQSKQRRAARMS